MINELSKAPHKILGIAYSPTFIICIICVCSVFFELRDPVSYLKRR